jgi:hypothetical protein
MTTQTSGLGRDISIDSETAELQGFLNQSKTTKPPAAGKKVLKERL